MRTSSSCLLVLLSLTTGLLSAQSADPEKAPVPEPAESTEITPPVPNNVQVVRSQVAMFSEDQSTRFLQSVALRQVANERSEILRQILTEKVALRNQVQQGLKVSYGWSSDHEYRFEEEPGRLIRLAKPAKENEEEEDESGNEEPAEEEIVHTFNNDRDLIQFRQLLAAKQSLDMQISALTSVLREQLDTLERVRDLLQDGFNVDPEKQYHYDHKEKVLYLLSKPEAEKPDPEN